MASTLATTTRVPSARSNLFTPAILRAGLLTLMAAVLIVSFHATGSETTNLAMGRDGTDLTRLMRFMAAIKGVIAIMCLAAVLWRLGAAISLPRFAAYSITCASMAAGPVLIWGMSHVVIGAVLLHGGLFATIVLLWNDPAVGARLADMVASRRRQIAIRTG